jgi:peroxiredoxin Q/BCP
MVIIMKKTIKNTFIVFTLALLSSFGMSAEWVGTPAPSFSLPDQNNQLRSLQDFKGQWIALYFYPKDGTPGCTQEAKNFRDQWESYQKNNIVIIGVSIDDVASHKDFAATLKLPFTLLSDEQHKLSKAMGLLRGFGPLSFASRQTFLIDPEGTIVYHYDSVDTKKHASQVLADVQRLSTAPSP